MFETKDRIRSMFNTGTVTKVIDHNTIMVHWDGYGAPIKVPAHDGLQRIGKVDALPKDKAGD